AAGAMGEIGVDHDLDRIGDLAGTEAAADDLTDRGLLVAGTAQRDLVELGALLLHAQYADMADMMVAAGIDAAGDLDLELADFFLPRLRAEALRNLLRHWNRARIGQCAIIEAGAGD